MIETVANQSGEIVTLDEARRQLGVWDSADDGRVQLLLEAARAYCEGWAEITLRLAATRTVSCDDWPAGGWLLKWPPVTGVTGITYYDTTNTQQTLATSNYTVNLTAAGFAVVEWTPTRTAPGLHDRPDAVTVTYATGWETAADAPPDAKAAVLLTLQHLYGEDEPKTLGYARNAAMRLLAGRSAWSYS